MTKDGVGNETNEDASIYIERDSLIQLQCKRGSVTTIENYRVLCPFTKFYNKWYVCADKTRFAWKMNSKGVQFLVQMMRKAGVSCEEVKLEKGGEYGPQSIFRMCSIEEVFNAVNDLIDF